MKSAGINKPQNIGINLLLLAKYANAYKRYKMKWGGEREGKTAITLTPTFSKLQQQGQDG